jgi:hypothetical protein
VVVVRFKRAAGEAYYAAFAQPRDSGWMTDGGTTNDCTSAATTANGSTTCPEVTWHPWSTPGGATPDTGLGVLAAHLKRAPDQPFPPGTTMLLTRGGKFPAELWRVTRIGDGPVVEERLFPLGGMPGGPPDEPIILAGIATSNDGSTAYAGLCQGTGCLTLDRPEDGTAASTFYRSVDGGRTWSVVLQEPVRCSVTGLAGTDLLHFCWDDDDGTFFQAGRPVTMPPPEVSDSAALVFDGRPAWVHRDSPARLIDAQGSTIMDFGGISHTARIGAWAAGSTLAKMIAEFYVPSVDPESGPSSATYLAAIEQGQVRHAVRLRRWLDSPVLLPDGRLVAGMEWDRPGACSPQGLDFGRAPVIIDIAAGTYARIAGPFIPDEGCGAYWRPLAVVQGDLARVAVGEGDCLNAREEPRADAPSRACWPDGAVLLLSGEPITDASGRAWRSARLGETEGWVAEEFLAR